MKRGEDQSDSTRSVQSYLCPSVPCSGRRLKDGGHLGICRGRIRTDLDPVVHTYLWDTYTVLVPLSVKLRGTDGHRL